MKIDIKIILLLICAIVILFLLPLNFNRETASSTTATTTSLRIDTLKAHDTLYFPLPYKVVEHNTDTLYIDTSKVIRDYFTDKYYLFDYQDTTLHASADIKVFQNAVEVAKFEYEVYRPTIHTSTVITERKIQRFSFSLGAGVNYNITDRKAGIELLTSVGLKRHNLLLGYDFINQTPRLGWQYQLVGK